MPLAADTAAPGTFVRKEHMNVPQPRVAHLDFQPPVQSFESTVTEGLSLPRKALPPVYFYDEKGSLLFEQICNLPEYYITRTEISLLEQIGPEFGQVAQEGCTVVEFGSGSSIKIRELLRDLRRPAGYVAIDISNKHLRRSAEGVSVMFPGLNVTSVCADFSQPLNLPEAVLGNGPRLGFFPGSTIGNMLPEAAAGFLRGARTLLGEQGAMFIGVDLKKDPAVLHAAYNDSQGVTAAFNLNLLERINRELEADFDLHAFVHEAFYNAELGRVEMHLRSLLAQQVRIAGQVFSFREGETIHTENSHKYSLEDFAAIAAQGGFRVERVWRAPKDLFSLQYLLPLPD